MIGSPHPRPPTPAPGISQSQTPGDIPISVPDPTPDRYLQSENPRYLSTYRFSLLFSCMFLFLFHTAQTPSVSLLPGPGAYLARAQRLRPGPPQGSLSLRDPPLYFLYGPCPARRSIHRILHGLLSLILPRHPASYLTTKLVLAKTGRIITPLASQSKSS